MPQFWVKKWDGTVFTCQSGSMLRAVMETLSRQDILAISRVQFERLIAKPAVTTNYDRIISKSPEELAEWVAGYVLNLDGAMRDISYQAWLKWLKQEATE